MWKGVLLSCWFALLACACSLEVGRETCSLCGRQLHAETLYEIELANGEQYEMCCPRCASHYHAREEQVVRARVADYFTTKMIDATRAFFVEDSSVMPCGHHREATRDHAGTSYKITWDRCEPGLIAFASRQEALYFQHRHGGLVKRFRDVFENSPQ